MPDEVRRIYVEACVERAKAGLVAHRQRRAVGIVLNSIARRVSEYKLYIKGGPLMSLAYGSSRQTSDIGVMLCNLIYAGARADCRIICRSMPWIR